MNDFTGAEQVELEHARFILLTYSRDWPKYVVSWSLRQTAERAISLWAAAMSSTCPT
jgi:hypothetical protein